MFTFLVVIHVITCTVLVITVLLQQGKGAEVGAVFGSSEAIFGSTGPTTLLSKVTTVSAVVFMLTSLSLTYLSIHSRGGESVMRKVGQAPAVPAQLPSMPGAPGAAGEKAGASPHSPSAQAPAKTPPAKSSEHQVKGSPGNAEPAEGPVQNAAPEGSRAPEHPQAKGKQ